MYFFLQVFLFKKNLTLCMTKLRVLVLCFLYFMLRITHIPAGGRDALISSLFDGLNSYMLES